MFISDSGQLARAHHLTGHPCTINGNSMFRYRFMSDTAVMVVKV